MTMLRLGVEKGWNPYGTGGLEPDRDSARPRPQRFEDDAGASRSGGAGLS